MSHWIAFIVFVVTFGCGILGLTLQRWPPERHMSDGTRDLINRVTGLVGTMTALVLGPLIASASSFYNTQKSSLEVTASRFLQLDGVLRRYGPEATPVRAQLRAAAIQIYEDDWGHGSATPPTVVDSSAAIDALATSLDSLSPATEAERFRHARANEIAAILVSWTSLLFFGFGITVHRNGTAIATLAVAAFAVATAVFLIIELSQPYSGLLRLPPTPLVQAIDALGK